MHLLVERRHLEEALKRTGRGPVTISAAGLQGTMEVVLEVFDERTTPFLKTGFTESVKKSETPELRILHVTTQ